MRENIGCRKEKIELRLGKLNTQKCFGDYYYFHIKRLFFQLLHCVNATVLKTKLAKNRNCKYTIFQFELLMSSIG